MRNQKKAGFRKLSGMNKVSLNADKHEGRFMNRAMKSMPWLICASAAWLTLVPSEMAFADIPADNKVHYDQKGEEAGGTVKDGKLIIDASVASEAVPKTGKDYFTSNWAKAGNATNGQTTIQSDVTIGDNSGHVWFVSGSLASIGTATNSSVTATSATVYGDVLGGDGAGSAHGNTVNIEGTTVSRHLYGGHSDNSDTEKDAASDNKVIVQKSYVGGVSLSNGTTSDGGLAGGQTFKGNAQKNKVFVTDSTIKPHSSGVYGGYTNNGNASENRIELNSSTVQSSADSQSSLAGGYAGSGTASFNTVILTGSAVNIAQGIFGGFTWSGVTSDNVVEVSGGNVKTPYVAGGYAYTGTANSNSVTISGSRDVESTVYGGYATNEASSNKVILSEGAVTGSLVGGYANEGTANSNSVTGTDSKVGWEVYGGQGTTGASSNTVELDNVKVSGKVRGGDTKSGEASNNKVSLSNGTTFTGNLYAGYTDNGNATGNEVSLSVVSAPKDVYASYTAKGQANSSKVTGSDSKVGGDVYGGRGTTGASSNKVDLNNVQVSGTVRGGKTTSGGASGNQIILSNKTTFTGDLYAGYTENGNATGNEISLSGVSAPKDVYASFTKKGQAGGTVKLSNNSSVTTSVYGGFTSDGVADGSEVAGSDSRVGGDVYGGQGTTGASSNTVDLNNVKVSGKVRGGDTKSGEASNNKVSLSNGTTFTDNLYAGYTENGNATGNEVSLSDVSAPKDVYASFTKKDQAGGIDDDTRSKVTITESSVTDSVYGGYTKSGAANYSSVTIIDSTIRDSTVNEDSIGSSVYAGYTESGESSYNQVTVSGSNAFIQGRVYGGYGTLDSSHNIVELSEGARVGYNVVGGHSKGDSSTNQNVLHNEVTVSSGSRVESGLYGGVITEGRGTGTVQYNTVNLNNAFAGYEVVGGVLLGVPTGIVEENHVNISAGKVEGNVYGGAFEYFSGTGNSDIRNNTVILSEGTVITKSEFSPDRPGSVYGGYNLGIGDVTGNRVTVSGSSRVDGDVYGGMVKGNDDSNPGSASQNKVRIESDSTVGGSVYGGWNSNGETSGNFIYVDGTVSKGATAGYTLSGDAAGNEVLVEGGTVLDHLYGGYTALGSATGNVITVKGGTVNAEMVGGYDDGTATNNTVTLYDSARFTGSDIYGGKSGGSSSDVFTGNTFNVYGQIDAASLQNFQNLNFYDVAEDKASVDLSRSAVIGDGKGSMTNVFIGNLRNQEGDIPEEYVLIHTPTASSSYTGTNLYVNGDKVVTIGPDGSYVPYSGTVANDGTMDNATGSTGMTKSQTLTKGFLTFEVDYFIKNGQDLIARWKKDAPVEVNSETEEFTASRQASAALMDEGADFVAGEGIDRALQASQCLPGEPCGAKAFVAVNGGYSTYKAGTTFDMSYGNMLAGIARQCKIGPMGYLAGVFFETGLSRFHSEYEPDDSRSIDSEGHDYYYGVGALAKVFLNRDLLKGLYAEGSIRYGLMMGDWQSHDIQSDGQTADWDGRAPYLTAHGGLGYMWDVTDNVTADVYAKYFWGHLWGDDGTICGQQFEFDDIYSSRVRTGAHLNFKKDEAFSCTWAQHGNTSSMPKAPAASTDTMFLPLISGVIQPLPKQACSSNPLPIPTSPSYSAPRDTLARSVRV